MTHLTHITPSARPKLVKRSWHIFDAKSHVLGRLATEVATHLIGKNKTDYSPEADMGDFIVVINSRHAGYPGGLKKVTLEKAKANKPNFIIHKAVWGMLPKNKLRKIRIKRLFIYESDTHPHQKEVIAQG